MGWSGGSTLGDGRVWQNKVGGDLHDGVGGFRSRRLLHSLGLLLALRSQFPFGQ